MSEDNPKNKVSVKNLEKSGNEWSATVIVSYGYGCTKAAARARIIKRFQ